MPPHKKKPRRQALESALLAVAAVLGCLSLAAFYVALGSEGLEGPTATLRAFEHATAQSASAQQCLLDARRGESSPRRASRGAVVEERAKS